MIKDTTSWYASWFDTPFYHILYKDRDYEEAESFMHKLTQYLNISKQSEILDLACGKGRHAIHLNTLGYDVTGVDLSESSIAYAKQFENDTLHFDVHDMCKPYRQKFDAVFNLFTSFGYFDNEDDNLNTIKAIKANLNQSGFGVIDFMNTEYIIENLIPENIKTVDGIDFNQKRYVKNGYIVKDISFTTEDKTHNFQERVKALSLKDFELLFKKADVTLLDVFGDYKLSTFEKKNSERLIMIFK